MIASKYRPTPSFLSWSVIWTYAAEADRQKAPRGRLPAPSRQTGGGPGARRRHGVSGAAVSPRFLSSWYLAVGGRSDETAREGESDRHRAVPGRPREVSRGTRRAGGRLDLRLLWNSVPDPAE